MGLGINRSTPSRRSMGKISVSEPLCRLVAIEKKKGNTNMKKLITLAIVAGILTVSLTSCLSKKGGGNDDTSRTPSGIITTDPSTTTTTTPISKNPADMTYLDDNTAVYVKVKGAILREVADTSKTSTVAEFSGKQTDKLTRTGISTDGSWSRVKSGETDYYILTSSLTTDDLLAETFAEMTEATCYIYDSDGGSVNLRTYPSSENAVSPILSAIKTGTAVTVLKTSLNGWVQIRADSKVGYVLGKFLKDNAPITLDTDFGKYFTDIESKVMYVSSEKANLRKIPYSGNEVKGSIVDTLVKGTTVTVIGEGTVDESKWYKIDWVIKGSNGVPDEHKEYYIHASTLADNATASNNLEDYMSSYPALKSNTKTMYVSANSLNARSTPAIEKGDDGKDVNIVKSLKKKDQVNVVAIGLFDGTVWALAQDTNSSFYFVSYAYLTTDSEGKPVPATLTLESIQELYNFQATTATGTVKVLANLYNTPEVADENKLAQLTAGTTVQIVGAVTVSRNAWYVIQYNGEYCFISQTQVTVAA